MLCRFHFSNLLFLEDPAAADRGLCGAIQTHDVTWQADLTFILYTYYDICLRYSTVFLNCFKKKLIAHIMYFHLTVYFSVVT